MKYVISGKMNGTGDHEIKRNNPDSERQICVFSHMQSLDLENKTKHERRKGTDYLGRGRVQQGRGEAAR